jgi:hypothetical protein
MSAAGVPAAGELHKLCADGNDRGAHKQQGNQS